MSENRPTFWRAFPAQIERAGPRQLTGRLVPYGVIADVLDELPDGRHDIYREGFRPGAFARQANIREPGVISKISLVHRHDTGGLGFLGAFTALHEAPDGLYGDVNVLRSKASDVEDLLDSGVGELSVEFRLPKANHTDIGDDGVRWRTRAHLDGVALEPKGAYRSAQVLAFRTQVEQEEREQAERQELADAEALVAEENRKRLEDEAEAAAERRRKFNELSGRLDGEREKQKDLIARYGLTAPPGRR